MTVYHLADFDPTDEDALAAYAEWRAAQKAEVDAWEAVEARMDALIELKKTKKKTLRRGASPEEKQLHQEISDLREQARGHRASQEEKLNKHYNHLSKKHPDPVVMERIRENQRQAIRAGASIPQEALLLDNKELKALTAEVEKLRAERTNA